MWGDEQVTLRLVPDGQFLKVVVVDDLGVEVELDQRSEGFRWLVSFFVVFRAQAGGDLKNTILLLDEPGVSLHALKQREFRRTLTLLGGQPDHLPRTRPSWSAPTSSTSSASSR